MPRRARTLVPRGGYGWGLALTLVVAAGLRFWQLSSLPPGLSIGEANLGLAAYHLSHDGIWPSFSSTDGASPLIVGLEALAQLCFGLAPWALRLVPALLGTLAVLTTFLWIRLWFGRRAALIAAFLLATTPWSLTLSRNVEPAALVPLLLSLSLWLATRLWHHHRTRELMALAVTIVATSFAGPAGWAIIAVLVAAGITLVVRPERTPRRALIATWTTLGLLVLLPAVIWLRHGRPDLRLISSAGRLVHTVPNVILAFLVHGDDSYLFNLGGQPLLNVFVGITAVAGLLVVATRLRRQPERIIGLIFVAALIPAIISAGDGPSAARLSLALVPVLVLSALGIGYMLQVWYTTFPINSAARITGQGAILILLALSAYQGYSQYFVAWANSSPTYSAYNEAPLAIARWARNEPATAVPIVELDPSVVPVVKYDLLNDRHRTIIVTTESQLKDAVKTRPLAFATADSSANNLVATLKAEAAGGTVQAHLSPFDQHELYYTYAIH